jgi:hypothetical protein
LCTLVCPYLMYIGCIIYIFVHLRGYGFSIGGLCLLVCALVCVGGCRCGCCVVVGCVGACVWVGVGVGVGLF